MLHSHFFKQKKMVVKTHTLVIIQKEYVFEILYANKIPMHCTKNSTNIGYLSQ